MNQLGVVQDPNYESDLRAEFGAQADLELCLDEVLKMGARYGLSVIEMLESVEHLDTSSAIQAISGRLSEFNEADHRKATVEVSPSLMAQLAEAGASTRFREVPLLQNVFLGVWDLPDPTHILTLAAYLHDITHMPRAHDVGILHRRSNGTFVELDALSADVYANSRRAAESVFQKFSDSRKLLRSLVIGKEHDDSRAVAYKLATFADLCHGSTSDLRLEDQLRTILTALPTMVVESTMQLAKSSHSVDEYFVQWMDRRNWTYAKNLSFTLATAAYGPFENTVRQDFASRMLAVGVVRRYASSKRRPRLFASHYLSDQERLQALEWIVTLESPLTFNAFRREFAPDLFAYFLRSNVVFPSHEGFVSRTSDSDVQSLREKLDALRNLARRSSMVLKILGDGSPEQVERKLRYAERKR